MLRLRSGIWLSLVYVKSLMGGQSIFAAMVKTQYYTPTSC